MCVPVRNYLYFVRLVFVVAILAHFFACGFFYTASLASSGLPGSWVGDDPVSGADAGVLDHYVASLYWCAWQRELWGCGQRGSLPSLTLTAGALR